MNESLPYYQQVARQRGEDVALRTAADDVDKLRGALRGSWDPSAFIGYSAEQVKLIKVGFDYALNEAYRQVNGGGS